MKFIIGILFAMAMAFATLGGYASPEPQPEKVSLENIEFIAQADAPETTAVTVPVTTPGDVVQEKTQQAINLINQLPAEQVAVILDKIIKGGQLNITEKTQHVVDFINTLSPEELNALTNQLAELGKLPEKTVDGWLGWIQELGLAIAALAGFGIALVTNWRKTKAGTAS